MKVRPPRPDAVRRPLTRPSKRRSTSSIASTTTAGRGAAALDLVWLGTRAVKCPFDLWVYQEILVETRPDFIFESGTRFGGTSLFLASILDLLGGPGRVLTLDIDPTAKRPVHPRIDYMIGSSLDPEVIASIHAAAAGHRSMVILDSDHVEPHVSAELQAYHDLVSPGCCSSWRTRTSTAGLLPDFGPGPGDAVDRFLEGRTDFVVDRDREQFLISLNPGGYLRRVSWARIGPSQN